MYVGLCVCFKGSGLDPSKSNSVTSLSMDNLSDIQFGVETSGWCLKCRELQGDLERLTTENAINCKVLKEKIISTEYVNYYESLKYFT